jgi:2-keto-4-pentenoate hydratase
MDLADAPASDRLAALLAGLRSQNRQQSGLAADLVPPDIPSAYRIAGAVSRRLGWAIGGWKIAAFKPEMQRRLRAGAPIYGPVYEQHIVSSGALLAGRPLLHPLVEVELIAVLRSDLPPRQEPYASEEVECAVESLRPGLEIAECRFSHDERFPPLTAILADGSGSGTLVLGEPIDDWRSRDFAGDEAQLVVNGAVRRNGSIHDAIEHPVAPLTWLANALSRTGVGLAAGTCVSTGTLTGMYLARPGDVLIGHLGRLGEVRAVIGE